MKHFTIFAALVLLGVAGAYGQQPEWVQIYSKEYHFIADFPGQPKESGGEIKTRFGNVPSKRWSVESPGLLFEVLVAELSEHPVIDRNSLYLFYDAVCADLFGDCSGGGADHRFDVLGARKWINTREKLVNLVMFLARNRFYLVKVVMDKPMKSDKQRTENVKTFIDKFLFAHQKDGKDKIDWGLPATTSQNLKSHR